MKLHFVVLLALLVSQGFAQAAPPQSKPLVSSESAAGTASSKPVAPDAPVISVAGICHTPGAKGECQTVITRAEFEKLVSLLSASATDRRKSRFRPKLNASWPSSTRACCCLATWLKSKVCRTLLKVKN